MVSDLRPDSGQEGNPAAGMNLALSKPGPISYRGDVQARCVPTTLAGGLTDAVAPAILGDGRRAAVL